MKKLEVESWHEIFGRGKVAVIDLEKNGISLVRKDFNLMMGSEVQIDGTSYIVKGIEAFATGESYLHRNVGLLVKEKL